MEDIDMEDLIRLSDEVFYLEDKELSLKARGMLATLLALPEDFHITVEGLTEIFPDGRTATRAALTELEKAGYLRRIQTRKHGAYFGTEYHISATILK